MAAFLIVALGCGVLASEAQAQTFRGDPEESPWHFKGDFGLPAASLAESSFAFDLELGYYGDSFIIGFDVAQSIFSKVQGETSRFNTDFRNHFILGYRTGTHETNRHMFLLDTDFTATTTDYTGEGFDSLSEFSTLGRESIVYGYASPQNQDLAWVIFAGVGFQIESFSKISFGDLDTGDDASEIDFSSFLLARLEAQYAIIPKLVTASLRSEFNLFSMTRSNLYFGADLADGGDGIETLTGVRLNNRLNGEVIGLEFVGLHPFLFLGLDGLIASGTSTATDFTPLIGVGLTN